jgi:hypothetical protein
MVEEVSFVPLNGGGHWRSSGNPDNNFEFWGVCLVERRASTNLLKSALFGGLLPMAK